MWQWLHGVWTNKAMPTWLLAMGAGGALFGASFGLFSGQLGFRAAGGLSVVLGLGAGGLVAFALRAPRAPSGTTGVIIALDTETDEHALRLHNDLVRSIRAASEHPQATRPISILEYSARLACRVNNNVRAAEALESSNARLIIFGVARIRKVKGRDHHVLDLQIGIQHKPIHEEVSAHAGRLLREGLPQRYFIDTNNDVLLFQVAARHMSLFARYALAIAALVSDDCQHAQELLEGLREEIDGEASRDPLIERLARLVPEQLHTAYAIEAGQVQQALGRTPQAGQRQRLADLNQLMLSLNPRSYPALLGSAIDHFVLRRDVVAAWRCINACKGNPDATWRYSAAFLHLYTGDLVAARKEYVSAARAPAGEASAALQSELFMEQLLKEEPDKYQLHYGIALVNLLVKGDSEAASESLGRFERAVDAGRYTRELEWAKRRLVLLQSGENAA